MKVENNRIEMLAKQLYDDIYPGIPWFALEAMAKEKWYRIAQLAIDEIDDWHKPQDKMPDIEQDIEFIVRSSGSQAGRVLGGVMPDYEGGVYFSEEGFGDGDYLTADVICWRYVTPAPDYALHL